MSTREIKFRYICRNKHFNEIQIEYITLEMLENRKELPTWIFSDNCEIISKDLFTGLKDKNGKEIYEGDIVLGKYGLQCVIVYDTTQLCFRAQWCSRYDEFIASSKVSETSEKVTSRKKYEVIGNIYQTPDLITR